jgi:laminin gamma 1
MSDISRNARGLAEELEKQAKEDRDKAANAKEKSESASELARKTVELQRDISEDLKVAVAPETVQLSKKLDGLKKMTTEALDKANTIYDESLTLLSNVKSISTPEINVAPIVTDSGKLINDTKTVNDELERLIDDKTELLNDLDSNMNLAVVLLER